MGIKTILFIFLLLHFIQVYVANDNDNDNDYCTFEEHQIRDEWRIILVDNGKDVHLMRRNRINNGSTVYMICNEKDIIEMKCVNGSFDVILPLPQCTSAIQAKVYLTKEKHCLYDMYEVGFNFKCGDTSYFMTTYRVCFDPNRMQTVYTINEAYPFVMRRPKKIRFDPDNLFTMKYFSAYNKREIYNRFQELLGHGQPFMSSDENERRLDRGHLVPAADYMINNMIRSTFKMINVIPQFHSINAGNWNILEEWIRQPQNTPANVCNGVLPYVLELPDLNGTRRLIFLQDNIIPVPLWTYKIVQDQSGNRFTFLQYNNIHEINEPYISKEMCERVPCPTDLHLRNSNFFGYTVCCKVQSFIVNNVPYLMGLC